MKIQILGMGCPKCEKLAEAVEAVAKEMGVDYELVKIKDLKEIMAFGVMMTPALAVDGVVRSSGRIPSADEIREFLG